ncbi:MAG: transporter substrate-binding protein [Moraxellaceae bacterium]|jgi:putative ABC transport system substrate-binding protein|nr:transporter substrate-binding protein [Moraxellaceae bacterium]
MLAALPVRAERLARAAPADASRERPGLVAAARDRAGPVRLAAADASSPASVPGSGIAVLYPDLGEPYREVFNTLIAGVVEQAGAAVRRYPLRSDQDSAGLQAQLRRAGVRVVIALGRQGLKAAASLDRDFPVVLGGIVAVPEGERRYTGISLTPDPAMLFSHLKGLLPGVRRIIVVYNPNYNDWLLTLARSAARAQGLELVAHEARDTATAARLYKELIVETGKRDAVWLPQDSTTVDEDTILPLVLRQAWQHRVPVFSSSFLHVKKGALFALYPDNRQLGRALAHTANDMLAGEPVPPGMLPLQAVLSALNVRTASHLGLNLDYQQQRRFDFVFPEP